MADLTKELAEALPPLPETRHTIRIHGGGYSSEHFAYLRRDVEEIQREAFEAGRRTALAQQPMPVRDEREALLVQPEYIVWHDGKWWVENSLYKRQAALQQPAQAVPLTEEQIEQCVEAWSHQGWGHRRGELTSIARAIERHHGIAITNQEPKA